jgi:tricarballylate dehydrogenase
MQEETCDVLVIGCGAAGLSAALSALEAGASVILLERSAETDSGGNTRWTEALMRVDVNRSPTPDFVMGFAAQPGNHVPPAQIAAMQQAPEDWSPSQRALPFLDPEVLDAFASSIEPTLNWIHGHGLGFDSAQYPFIMAGLLTAIRGGGLAVLETLRPLVEQKGGRILYEMTATQFLLDDALGVVGVKALSAQSGGANIRARHTILACGGFEGNPAMLTQYMGEQARYMRPVAEGGWNNKGEGIRLALDIGAAPAGDYAEAHRQPIDPRSSVSEALVNAYPFGIVVNANGRRFMDEAPPNPMLLLEEHCRTINRQPGGIGYFIYDAAIDDIPAWMRMVRTDIAPVHADTIGDLADRIGVPRTALEAEVATYNAACGSGTFGYARDDAAADAAYQEGAMANPLGVFDGLVTQNLDPPKSNWARPIKTGPFGCFPIISSITFTFGGLKVNRHAQVIRTSGAVIPGLYAAGETVGMMYGTYVGATSVLRALVFGRIAGGHAAMVAA